MKKILFLLAFGAQVVYANDFQGTWTVSSCKLISNGQTHSCEGNQNAIQKVTFEQQASNIPMSSAISYTGHLPGGAVEGLTLTTMTNNHEPRIAYTKLEVLADSFNWHSFYQNGTGSSQFKVSEDWILRKVSTNIFSFTKAIVWNMSNGTKSTSKWKLTLTQ